MERATCRAHIGWRSCLTRPCPPRSAPTARNPSPRRGQRGVDRRSDGIGTRLLRSGWGPGYPGPGWDQASCIRAIRIPARQFRPINDSGLANDSPVRADELSHAVRTHHLIDGALERTFEQLERAVELCRGLRAKLQTLHEMSELEVGEMGPHAPNSAGGVRTRCPYEGD